MISTFIIVFVFMLMFVVVMAVGVIFGRKPVSGSCGGMSAVGMESECDVCGGDQSKCDGESPLEDNIGSKGHAYYDATN